MNRGRCFGVAALAAVLAATSVAKAEDEADAKPIDEIVIEVWGLKNDNGRIGCSIFSKEDGFPSEVEKADKRMWVKSKSKKATCTFKDVKPGTYAIATIQDVDNNGELNRSFVGKPKEPWGVSNNAPAQRFGPPLYKDATFKDEGGKKVLKIKLQ